MARAPIYLTQELGVGDDLELRGPIGGYFTWRARDGGPLLLIAGGSGLVPRRIDAEMLCAVGPAPTRRPRIFVCGPTAFVERAADLLITLGHEPATIRTERSGPPGG